MKEISMREVYQIEAQFNILQVEYTMVISKMGFNMERANLYSPIKMFIRENG